MIGGYFLSMSHRLMAIPTELIIEKCIFGFEMILCKRVLHVVYDGDVEMLKQDGAYMNDYNSIQTRSEIVINNIPQRAKS